MKPFPGDIRSSKVVSNTLYFYMCMTCVTKVDN